MKSSESFDMQRRVVSHMVSESWNNIPHVSYLYEPDVTDFYREFQSLAQKQAQNGRKISFNTILLKAIIDGIKAAPKLNAHISYNHKKGEGVLHQFSDINISIPWVLPDGRMITPVIEQTEDMSLNDLSDNILCLGNKIANTNIDELLYRAAFHDTITELKKLHFGVIRRILASKITFHQIRGLSGKEKDDYYKQPVSNRLTEQNLISATVTVSNIGSLYKEQTGCFGFLEIIPPQIFAIGIGAIQEKPGILTLTDGRQEIAIRKTLPMCLTFDHRAVDFSALVPFLKKMDEIFSHAKDIVNW